MPVFYSTDIKDILDFCTMSISRGNRQEMCYKRTLAKKKKEPASDLFKSYILKLITDVLVTTAGKESKLVTDSRKIKTMNSFVLYVLLGTVISFTNTSHLISQTENSQFYQISMISHTELHPCMQFNTDNSF